MKFRYFTNNSEESLAPLFSERVLLSIRFYFACVLFPSLILWPRNSFAFFIEHHDTPVFYPTTFILTLLLFSHLSLRYGKGEFGKVNYISDLLKKNIITQEESQPFFSCGFINFISFSVIITLTASPILLTAAAVSGIQIHLTIKSIVIIFIISFLSELIGFLNYLIFGRWKIIGYLSSRAAYGFLLFGTGLVHMELNPIYQLYLIYRNLSKPLILHMESVNFYLLLLASSAGILSIISHVIIQSRQSKDTGI